MQISGISQTEYLNAFQSYLEKRLRDGEFELLSAMEYATLDGGKRIRPLLVRLGVLAVGDADLSRVLPLACAVELVHSYSLVHDDLPAMDNDDYRRGKLSVHKKFGEANGILTGDALLTEAANCLLQASVNENQEFVAASCEIMTGAGKMVDGQVLDLAGCKLKDEYLQMYAKKTGALIAAAMRAGAKLAGASVSVLGHVDAYARHLGLAFQLADDLLDDDGEPSIICAIGREETKKMLSKETELAIESAKHLKNADELVKFANMLAVRNK